MLQVIVWPNVFQMEVYEVLIVEDDSAIRDTLIDIVEMLGYTLREAMNGESALHMIRDHLPDLIISDIMMPVMDGISLLRTIRSSPAFFSLPVIIVTAKTNLTAATVSKGLIAEDLVIKPFELADLSIRIQLQLNWRYRLIKDLSLVSASEELIGNWVFVQRLNHNLQLVTEACSAQEMATRMHLDLKGFNQLLSNYSDFEFSEYLRLFKMYTAKVYYDTGFKDLQKLVILCNYQSQSDFCFHFMKLFQIDLISES